MTGTGVRTSIEACTANIDAGPWTHYCVTRRDLPRGTQAAQLIHAAGHSSDGNLPQGTFAIALSTADEVELSNLSARLTAAGVSHAQIHEPDEPYNGQLMALGLTPAPKSRYRKLLSNLPLIK